MIEVDWKSALILLGVAVSVGHAMWRDYYLKHNIPELWKELHALKDLYHALNKDKLTREMRSGGKDE